MEHSNRPLNTRIPVYANEGDYTVIKSKVAKEDLYVEGLKKALPVEEASTPSYNPGKIAAIIQAFLDL